ncbi:MAG: copper chaperone PCu(A)C [Emcibacter sp.]|nr:copper chaperone PCu(A)C [Emcibacter sp.]
MKLLLSIMIIFSSAQFSFAEEGVLTITDAWARPVILQNRPLAAYFIIKNDTGKEDKLIKVTSSLADRVEMHTHKHDGGVMRMMRVEAIPVAANGIVAVKPGGYHLMLFGVKKKLAIGDELPLTLTFAHSGKIQVIAKIMKKAS